MDLATVWMRSLEDCGLFASDTN